MITINELLAKHEDPIRLKCDPASNETVLILACEKQDSPRTTTEGGMEIDAREQ
jgi:hypothetical protein